MIEASVMVRIADKKLAWKLFLRAVPDSGLLLLMTILALAIPRYKSFGCVDSDISGSLIYLLLLELVQALLIDNRKLNILFTNMLQDSMFIIQGDRMLQLGNEEFVVLACSWQEDNRKPVNRLTAVVVLTRYW